MPEIFQRHEKAAEAEREAQMRRRVYPRLVSQGKMTELAAERGIRLMEAIAEDYRGQRDLFAAAGVGSR